MTAESDRRLLKRALRELKAERRDSARLLERLQQQDIELDRLRHSVSHESNSRLLAEEALDDTQDRLRLAVEAARLALWEWDIPAGKVFMTERWGEMIGDLALPSDWHVDSLTSQVHPEDRPGTCAQLTRVLTGRSER